MALVSCVSWQLWWPNGAFPCQHAHFHPHQEAVPPVHTRNLSTGWSAVLVSNKSLPCPRKKDKAELVYTNEKLAYNKLSRITG